MNGQKMSVQIPSVEPMDWPGAGSSDLVALLHMQHWRLAWLCKVFCNAMVM